MTSGSEKMSAKEKALKKLEEAKARLQQIEAREKENNRKIDARRKILLGAAVLQDLDKLAGLDGMTLGWIRRMPSRDRELFTELEARLTKKVQPSQTAQRAQEPPQAPQRAQEPPQAPQRAQEPPQTAQPVDDFSYDLTTLGSRSSR